MLCSLPGVGTGYCRTPLRGEGQRLAGGRRVLIRYFTTPSEAKTYRPGARLFPCTARGRGRSYVPARRTAPGAYLMPPPHPVRRPARAWLALLAALAAPAPGQAEEDLTKVKWLRAT